MERLERFEIAQDPLPREAARLARGAVRRERLRTWASGLHLLLLAAWAGLYGPEAAQSGAFIAEAAAPLTTTLSAAYLRAAAKGECMAHWHALFEGMLHLDAAATRTAIKVLMSIGHTSGADALAGFLAIYHLSDQNNM